MAKQKFVADRFDDIEKEPGYIGLRRLRRRRAFWLIPAGVFAGSSLVLIVLGLWWVDQAGDSLEIDASEIPIIAEPEPEPEPELVPEPEPVDAEPIINPTVDQASGLTVTVLNGTLTQGLAARAGDLLTAEGWPEQTLANAETNTVDESFVAYRREEDEGLARGAAQILGIEEVLFTDRYLGARITVVLGADYSAE
jgi:hypothetical protein